MSMRIPPLLILTTAFAAASAPGLATLEPAVTCRRLLNQLPDLITVGGVA